MTDTAPLLMQRHLTPSPWRIGWLWVEIGDAKPGSLLVSKGEGEGRSFES